MERAMQNCDMSKLAKLIQKAKDIDFDGETVLSSMEFYDKVGKISETLSEAVKHKRGGLELEEVIEQAKMIYNFDSESLLRAEEMLSELMSTEDADHNELLDALEGNMVHMS